MTANKQLRKLGNNGLQVSPVGLGCMGMSEFYGARDDRESFTTLNKAIDIGVHFWDTADIYGPKTNEQLLGRYFREHPGHRDKIVLATKFGIVRDDAGEFMGVNSRPEYVKQACEASLSRLGLEYIDLYYQHRVDPDVAIEETMGAMADLVKELAEQKDCTSAQLALSWINHQHETYVSIPGTRNVKRLVENAESVNVTLSADELDKISSLFTGNKVAGTRYPEAMMSLLEG